mmetsp:Transcript_26584/g.58260  ORF Transcript_26584/g.58260 Transcript_26584/m.58260 type:complete len:279 (+) Transcript_26584:61-897(+)|eukprot:CAMPEP_0178515606 /NCGR_PEP_ID=MMETSP0696-20121128/24646_1 /TAXON_ID=265572 /ORGANISM="Extubocellulus spinifer, Strain CCMP396" /LENGTH=278 /DNA_ID=CAMNT_0020145779 /DNA_START=183 /DNA_END=1019 /DNA_ORIENTATION=+
MNAEGNTVAKGNHVVPPGVAVEELDGGKKKLRDECPPELNALLTSKPGAFDIYDRLVKEIVAESSTRNVFGKWRDMEFDSILDQVRDEFALRGIRVALCKRSSMGGTYRWLEFIDTEVATDYVPQFDVANFSGQTIKTCYSTLYFPNGVAVEKFNRYGEARKKLKERCPIYVEKLLAAKGLMGEYEALVDDFILTEGGCCMQNWDTAKLQAIVDAHKHKFEARGVAVFISHKQEYISHGQYGGHYEYFRWVEFVNRDEQPNYYPQRDALSKKEKCAVM